MEEKKKGFLSKLFGKMDSKLEEKAKEKPCCCKKDSEGKCCE